MSVKESITEGHDPNYNTPVYQRMIEIMLEHLKKMKEEGHSDKENMYKELADYYLNEPTAVEDDIMHLSWNDIMKMGEFIEFMSYVRESAWEGYSQQDCINLAQRYHFMLLTKLSKEWDEPTYGQKQETFRAYEEMCDKVINGEISKEKFEFLKTLPEISEWDHDVAYDMTYGSPFFPDKPKYIEKDNVDNMVLRYLADGFSKDDRFKAESSIRDIRRAMSEEDFRDWIIRELRELQVDNVNREDSE